MVTTITHTAASLRLITRFIVKVFPVVDRELAYWRQYACNNGCPELREQAMASISDKKFHCQGGSIYSLYPGVDIDHFVKLVVALQTISDYLDNLCDRAGFADEQAFRQLHLALTDALDPLAQLADYYRYYPYHDDGGYLPALVRTCRQQIAKLPAYPAVKAEALRLAALYSDLQTYKHLDPSVREDKMLAWINTHLDQHPEITAWEFAAATGSTLGMFMLCAAAFNPRLTAQDATKISAAYFPWISGLHILLDYFIDGAEDRANGDLNFIFYYDSPDQTLHRLQYFGKQALRQAESLSDPLFAQTVVRGLLALYLSDPKTKAPQEQAIRNAVLSSSGAYTNLLYYLCKLLRLKKTL